MSHYRQLIRDTCYSLDGRCFECEHRCVTLPVAEISASFVASLLILAYVERSEVFRILIEGVVVELSELL